jgi:hypothetical protein
VHGFRLASTLGIVADVAAPIDPAFLAFLRDRLAEDMAQADRRAANAWDPTAHPESPGANLDPEQAERGLLLLRELLAGLEVGRTPDQMSRDLLVAAYSRHPEFRPEWNRWRRG